MTGYLDQLRRFSSNAVPGYNLINDVIYSCSGGDVNTVIIDGKIVVEKGHLLTVKEKELIDQAQACGKDLLQRAIKLEPKLKRWFTLGSG